MRLIGSCDWLGLVIRVRSEQLRAKRARRPKQMQIRGSDEPPARRKARLVGA